jgi:ElaB/YqjD/DUF883 family membrane-anchored ribosome-binding protein
MSVSSDNLSRATARSLEARQRLASTMVDIQARLAPQRLLREGLDELRETAGEVGQDTIDYVRARPGQVFGIVAALIVFLARDMIADTISRASRTAVKPRRKRRVKPETNALPRKDTP